MLRARPKPEALNRASPCPSAWTACGFGAQAFRWTSAFNANIGAWNTVAVTSLFEVCAAVSARRRALWRMRSAGASVRRGPLCAAAPPRARVHTCRHSLARGLGCRYGRAEGRFDTCIRIYLYICVRVCYTCICTYIIHVSVYVRIGRGYVCVHQCAMVMDRLCAHALAGSCCGLGLNPKP